MQSSERQVSEFFNCLHGLSHFESRLLEKSNQGLSQIYSAMNAQAFVVIRF
jgi:hypothetical protein